MSIRILLVDDYEDWRNQVRLLLRTRPEVQVVGEASDGLQAIQKVEELKPALVLLDIGLPKLDGIEAASRIRQASPNSRVIFLTADNSVDVVQAGLGAGAQGFVHKARAHSDLLPAIDAVLRGTQFVSSSLRGCQVADVPSAKAPNRHEVLFYSDDAVFLDSFTRVIAVALKAGNAAIVVATKSHRDGLLQRLEAEGLDVEEAIQQGTYIVLDATDALSTIMVNGLPDPIRFFEGLSGLIEAASKAAKAEHPRVVLCGERTGLLWAEGDTDAAIRIEQLCNDLIRTHKIDMLCAFPLSSIHGEDAFQSICAEHSAVYSQGNV